MGVKGLVVPMELQPDALSNSDLQTIFLDHITRGIESARKEVMVLWERIQFFFKDWLFN